MASTRRSDGEGSIYYDKARDRHIGSLVVGWRDGRPIRRKVSAKSRAAAATKLRELREKVAAGQLPSGRLPTVAEWLTFWLDEIAASKVRPSTLRGYRTYVTQYLIPLLGQHRLDRLRPEHVEAAWKAMQETGGRDGKGLSPTSAHQAHRILARALKVAQQRGYTQGNAAALIDAPTPAHNEVDPFTRDEARAILAVATLDRLRARWTVALALGLRQGEALGLCWDMVDLDEGIIRVRRALSRVKGEGLVLGKPKSNAGRRDVALPAELHQQLRAHRAAQAAERLHAHSWWTEGPHGGFVFAMPDGKPIDPRADWQAWKRLLTAAGVRDGRLHDARHTAATLMLEQGIDLRVVMDTLGWSQMAMGARYQHVLDPLKRDAADKMGSALWGS